jgi:hypothetical protein
MHLSGGKIYVQAIHKKIFVNYCSSQAGKFTDNSPTTLTQSQTVFKHQETLLIWRRDIGQLSNGRSNWQR